MFLINNGKSNVFLRPQSGFTLIEILVSVAILAIGLLGLAGLQVATMRFNHSSYMRSQATNFAYDIADRMRANSGAARNGEYDGGFNDAPQCIDNAADLDMTGTIAVQDTNVWRNTLACSLPSGTGRIATGANNIITITIRWDENRDSSNPQSFVMETDL